MCRAIHISNFHLVRQPGQLLFVNLDPTTYVDVAQAEYEIGFMVKRMEELGVDPQEFVCEVIEEKSQDDRVFADIIECFKSFGIKVAVDDFGVRFSDRNRIERLCPRYRQVRRFLVQVDAQDTARQATIGAYDKWL